MAHNGQHNNTKGNKQMYSFINNGGVKHVYVVRFGHLVAIDVTDLEGLGETVSFVALFESWHVDERITAELYLAEEFDMLPTWSWVGVGNNWAGQFAYKRNYKCSSRFSAVQDL